ncbi:DUF4376 domain-containing protein [Shinella sp. DD12]|uniref:DUF4376 domain-containing protein n=1 Tax=Shinella sp. DD12 TaxID=1410620 RepID=UPI0003C55ED9|nr:DUF4376 domain-containing protein [Shinella sp. DD12]EYR81368.1 hypothetical protein SHLA_15c000530 [Shinella sp. DD12]
MDYQRILLSGPTIDGEPGLPAALVGLSDDSLADLAASVDPCPADYDGVGYWLIQEADQTPAGKVVVGSRVELVGGQPKWIEDLEDAPPPSEADVDAERDRRISAGFSFAGVIYQSRPGDRENIMGAGTAALGAMMQGALPGNLRWHGGDTDFAWIAADNSLNPMDAQTVYAFGLAAMAHKTAHIFAARAIKDANPVPADFADNIYWP